MRPEMGLKVLKSGVSLGTAIILDIEEEKNFYTVGKDVFGMIPLSITTLDRGSPSCQLADRSLRDISLTENCPNT